MRDLNTQVDPPDPGPRHLVLRLKAGEEMTLLVLSDAHWGVWTHYNGRSTEPCFKEKAACPGCKKGYPSRWKAYLCCMAKTQKNPLFLELTPDSFTQLCNLIGDRGNLRGLVITAKRGKGDKARLTISLQGNRDNEMDRYPAGIDPQETLMALWGLRKMKVHEDENSSVDFIPLAQ